MVMKSAQWCFQGYSSIVPVVHPSGKLVVDSGAPLIIIIIIIIIYSIESATLVANA
jgi:hypothetical protein